MERSTESTTGGRSIVLALYAGIVAFSGLIGFLLGTLGPQLFQDETGSLRPVLLLGIVEIQPTPLGLALYGIVTIAIVLGVPLALVILASRHVDEE